MANKVKDGFYTALGTPVDLYGNLVQSSMEKHVKDQVEYNASGLLVMGSMGLEPYIKQSEYAKVAKVAVEAAKGRCPVFVGAMDNSVARVEERIKSLQGLKIDGVVLTTPFYMGTSQEELKSYFTKIAAISPFPVYLYDLPSITKVKINADTVEYLMDNDNIKGIKTGDIFTARVLMRSEKKKDDFSILFSGLDIFDVAYKYGIKMNLDGMFSCTHPIADKMYRLMEQGDYRGGAACLDQILTLRNLFIKVGVMRGFSYAMNLMGYEGYFCPDYTIEGKEEEFACIKEFLKEHGLI
ncbi:MAG: dihydrodipicolinate synthase family protein [Firmicutes bacterium]|nr:dihydrodipicolinate synthase family protein [Bacillota bacterium]